jgi:formylglycine-generating enzyme required for sulfatase activity
MIGALIPGATKPVGSYPGGGSPYGALDMAGNVWEWVADWYAGDYYANSPDRNPRGPESSARRVVRGGSWVNNAWNTRPTSRNRLGPSFAHEDVGFRCARSGSGS